MKRSLCKLLCLILALCMIIGCFTGCESASGGRDRDDEEETEKEDIRDSLEKYELNGLTYYLGEEFGDNDSNSDGSASHESDDAAVAVACGPMSDVAENDIASSKEFAQFFADEMGGMYDDVEKDSANGVHYTVGDTDGLFQVCGFYVEGGYGWIIMAETEDEDLLEDLIQYVTLGEIDEDFDAEDYLSASGDDYEDNEYDDIEVAPAPQPAPSYDTFTVHAYVPDSWGYPGCWAWSNTTGENVFSAWPGEPLTHVNGYYYTIEIPTWAEYIIINGNDGTIQTADEPVEPGCDVWVIIGANGDSYGVFFNEPGDADFSAFGY